MSKTYVDISAVTEHDLEITVNTCILAQVPKLKIIPRRELYKERRHTIAPY
jgi:hypothetical protein